MGKDPLDRWQEEREDKTAQDHDDTMNDWNSSVEDDD